MAHLLHRIWIEDDGVLTFEWTMLLTLLVLGVVGGVAAARDAITDELGDTAQVMQAVDQSYHIGFPLVNEIHGSSSGSGSNSTFIDAMIYTDCGFSDFIAQDFADDGFPDGA